MERFELKAPSQSPSIRRTSATRGPAVTSRKFSRIDAYRTGPVSETRPGLGLDGEYGRSDVHLHYSSRGHVPRRQTAKRGGCAVVLDSRPQPRDRIALGTVFLEDIQGAAAYAAGEAASVSGLRVLGWRRLEITLTSPLSFFPGKLSAGPTLVVDRFNVATGDDWWRSPNGSGPYRLAEWQPESHITLRRAATASWLAGGPEVVEFLQLDVGEDLLRYESDALDLVAIGGSNLDRFRDPNEPRNGQLLSTPDLAFQHVGSIRHSRRWTTYTCGGPLRWRPIEHSSTRWC